MIIVPNRFNVIAKEPMRKGKVDVGMRGFFAETDILLVRANNILFSGCDDDFIKRLIELYAPFAVMWNNNPELATFHTTRNDPRLYFFEV